MSTPAGTPSGAQFRNYAAPDAAPVTAEEVSAHIAATPTENVPTIIRYARRDTTVPVSLYPSTLVGPRFQGVKFLLTPRLDSVPGSEPVLSVLPTDYLSDNARYMDHMRGIATARGETAERADEFARWIMAGEHFRPGDTQFAYDLWASGRKPAPAPLNVAQADEVPSRQADADDTDAYAQHGAATVLTYLRHLTGSVNLDGMHPGLSLAVAGMAQPLSDHARGQTLINTICDVLHAGDGHYSAQSIAGSAFSFYDRGLRPEVTAETEWHSLDALGATVAVILEALEAGTYFTESADEAGNRAIKQFRDEVEEARFDAVLQARTWLVSMHKAPPVEAGRDVSPQQG
ncbi:hypothetical protein ABT246_34040 [Streptomyces sp. NPDC001553]|uniref:hypothetical protein n=1 Tax=Streptomyces sp. NPDC001553 TaxID=3154385 RepID=UPI00331D7369